MSSMAAIEAKAGNGWGGRIRTCECRYQKPVPYRLATPHSAVTLARPEGAAR
jgi:hypothetical protein